MFPHASIFQSRLYRVDQKKLHSAHFQFTMLMQPFKLKRNSFHQNVVRVHEHKGGSFYAAVNYSL